MMPLWKETDLDESIYDLTDIGPVTDQSIADALVAAAEERADLLSTIWNRAWNGGDLLTAILIDLSNDYGYDIVRERMKALAPYYGLEG